MFNKILAKFDSTNWSIIKRKKFYEDFKILNEADLLKLNDDIAIANWENLLSNNITDRAIVSVVTNTKKTNDIIKYYNEYLFRLKLSDLSIARRRKFFDEFVPIVENNNAYAKVVQKPNSIDLVLEHQKELKKIYKDALEDLDLVDNIKSNMNEDFIDLLIIKTKTLPNEVKLKYLREIDNEVISVQRLRSLQEGDGLGDFVNSLNPEQLKEYLYSNKLFVTTEVYDRNGLVGIYAKKFISGDERHVKDDIFNGNLPIEISEPDYLNYNIFKRKAYDFEKSRKRENDTELKYIYDLIKNHWRTGNRFVIKIESTLYTCQSCQGYLGYLKELAKQHGNVVEIQVISDPRATTTNALTNILNP